MRVETRNEERPVNEMYDMFAWCTDQFGNPGRGPKGRWIYGRDSVDFVGNKICNGPFDVEWIEFFDEKDATVFALRWA